MKILAVDTSTSIASIAIMDKDKLIGEYSIDNKKKHSRILMPMIVEVMNNLELKPEDIDLFGVTKGPGSFTGIRIGVTAVKAMAYAAKRSVVGVSALEALAYNLPMAGGYICPIMDARNDQVYTGLYEWKEDTLKEVTECMGISIQELVQLIKSKKIKTTFVGDAVELHKEYLAKQLGDNVDFAPANLLLQKAGSVALIAAIKQSKGEVQTPFDLIPFYLRKSQAEREYEKKLKDEKDENGEK